MKPKVIIPAVIVVLATVGGFVFVNNKSDDTKTANSSNSGTSQNADNGTKDPQESMGGGLEKLPAQTVGEQSSCDLYALDELSKLWGVPMIDTDTNKVISTSDGGKLYSCGYNQTDSGKGLTFSIEYREFMSVDKAKSDIKNTRDGAKFGETVYFVQDEAIGIGDEAFFSLPKSKVGDPKNPEEQLYVRKGNVVMLITALDLDGARADFRDKIKQSYKLHFE